MNQLTQPCRRIFAAAKAPACPDLTLIEPYGTPEIVGPLVVTAALIFLLSQLPTRTIVSRQSSPTKVNVIKGGIP
ncbi:hypothetical protein ACVWZK_001570 [Bradyrhizobium sp. GM0.4]